MIYSDMLAPSRRPARFSATFGISMQDIRVALAQITCRVGQIELNLKKHRECAKRAAGAGARIVCFPELSLPGYPHVLALPHDLARPLDGEFGQAVAALSAETDVAVLAGMLERDRSGVLYNTHLVASPAGLLGGYRKTHVPNSEIHLFSHGDELPVFTLEGVSFGILICYDNHFPEASRILALRGAEIIFCPYSSPGPDSQQGVAAKQARWLRYLPARAFDNSVYVVVVNQVGRSEASESTAAATPHPATASTPRDTHAEIAEFPGGSMVLDPWGEVIAQVGSEEELLIVDLAAVTLKEKRADALQFFTHFRRPELYAELARPSQAWIPSAKQRC